jgi:hypothetical protein
VSEDTTVGALLSQLGVTSRMAWNAAVDGTLNCADSVSERLRLWCTLCEMWTAWTSDLPRFGEVARPLVVSFMPYSENATSTSDLTKDAPSASVPIQSHVREISGRKRISPAAWSALPRASAMLLLHYVFQHTVI